MIMKRTLIAFFYFQMLVMMASCQKPIQPSKPPTVSSGDSTKLFIVWSQNFQPDSVSVYFHDPVFSGDYIVYASRGDEPEADIRIFHKLTGERHSAWQHKRGSLIDRNRIDNCIIGGNNQSTVFVTNKFELYAFDVNTGQRLWKKDISPHYGMHSISTMGTSVLQNYGQDALSKSWYRISSFDPMSGQERIITQLNAKDNYEFDILPPAWTINATGDTLLLFLSNGWNFYLSNGRLEAYCYNVTQNKMEWVQKDFAGNSNGATWHTPIIIENNKVIFQGLTSIHCFDIGTGKLVWQYDMMWRDGFGDTPFLYYKGKLLVRGEGLTSILYCYDAQTGQLLWQNTGIKAIACPWGRMDAYNDKLYFTAWRGSETGALYCVSIATGEVEWYELPKRGKIVFGVLIDQRTGYLYCYTGWSMLCVDLNKTPRK